MAAQPTSLGRTVPFTPLSGKYGYVTIGGVNLNLAQWTPQQATNLLSVTNFNSPQDANSNVHQEDIAGTIGTTFSVVGVMDASATGYRPTAGDTGTGVFGYSAAIFFPINFIVQSVGGPVNIDDKSGIEFTVKAVGLGLLTGRNGGA